MTVTVDRPQSNFPSNAIDDRMPQDGASLKSGMKRSDLNANQSAAASSQTPVLESAEESLRDRIEFQPELPSVKISSPATTALALISCGLFFVIGMLLFSGAVCILNLRHWTWALTMAILCIVPLHPGAILGGIPVGIWAVVELFRYSNRTAFDSQMTNS